MVLMIKTEDPPKAPETPPVDTPPEPKQKLTGLSEFKASQNLNLYLKDDNPCGSEAGAKEVLVKKGDPIPKVFIPNFLLNNRNFISNLLYLNGIPQITQAQEKEYDLTFEVPKPQELKLKESKYNQEKLTIKLNELGAKKFKEWAEEVFGEDAIDKRMSASKLIGEMLRIQEERRRE